MRTFGALKALAEGTPGARKPTLATAAQGQFLPLSRDASTSRSLAGQESVSARDVVLSANALRRKCGSRSTQPDSHQATAE
jgi:hypothetical protein